MRSTASAAPSGARPGRRSGSTTRFIRRPLSSRPIAASSAPYPSVPPQACRRASREALRSPPGRSSTALEHAKAHRVSRSDVRHWRTDPIGALRQDGRWRLQGMTTVFLPYSSVSSFSPGPFRCRIFAQLRYVDGLLRRRRRRSTYQPRHLALDTFPRDDLRDGWKPASGSNRLLSSLCHRRWAPLHPDRAS
jgi:hypothetical protein